MVDVLLVHVLLVDSMELLAADAEADSEADAILASNTAGGQDLSRPSAIFFLLQTLLPYTLLYTYSSSLLRYGENVRPC